MKTVCRIAKSIVDMSVPVERVQQFTFVRFYRLRGPLICLFACAFTFGLQMEEYFKLNFIKYDMNTTIRGSETKLENEIVETSGKKSIPTFIAVGRRNVE